MNDDEAVEGLTDLGLTTYESRVFVALQKLGMATASEISDVAEVPRSQVYGAAAGLEDRGLLETQQGRPTRYRPVPLAEARERLLERIERIGTETFDYLESIQESHAGDEQSEAIWMVNGADSIVSRTIELVDGAEGYVIYAAARRELVEADVVDALAAAAADGLTVVVASANPAVLDAVANTGVETHRIPPERAAEGERSGRILLGDHDTMLMSVVTAGTEGEDPREVAFWSSSTALAEVLVDFLEERLAGPLE